MKLQRKGPQLNGFSMFPFHGEYIFYLLKININHTAMSVITFDIHISLPSFSVYSAREHKSCHIDSVFCQ